MIRNIIKSTFVACVLAFSLGSCENDFDAKIIESGYKNVEGYHGNGGVHGYIYRMNISLLRQRRYKTMLFIDRSMRRLSGR